MKPAPLLLISLLASGIVAEAQSDRAANGGPEPVGFWRFEKDVKSEVENAALGTAKRMDGAELFFSDEVAAHYIYDPLRRLSYPNNASLIFQSKDGHNDALEVALDAAQAGLVGESVTLELFFKPDGEWEGPLAMKARVIGAAAEWGLEARYFAQHRQTYLHAFFTAPGGKTEHFRPGHYGTSAQIFKDNLDWRHMAFVHDTAAKTLTCYIDYYQVKTIAAPAEMRWDSAPLYIGGGPKGSIFAGKIDEARLTRGALKPTQFLRARAEPIEAVSFESEETVLPRDTGYIDAREAFGAVGDGKTDDTAALNAAFAALANRVPLAYHTLYLPPGTYLVRDTLLSSRFFSVRGAGEDRTVIKLRDKADGFQNPADPRPVWRASSTKGPPGSNSAVNGSSISLYIRGLTIDTGKGNPGAKGLEYHSNNIGRLEDVTIRSGDGAGVVGLDLTHKANGPALIDRVRVSGFDYGITSEWQEYSMTMEHIALDGQRKAGISNKGNILAIRGLTSTNKVPALISEGANSMITLLDSTLTGGGVGEPAIRAGGALYALRVKTDGYKSAVEKRILTDPKAKTWTSETIPGPVLDEYIGDHVVTGHGSPKGALKLPIEDTPEVPWGDIRTDWVNVKSFEDKKAGDDWTPAIQAAIDSGAKTIYFPQGDYPVEGTLHLRGKTERLYGMHGGIGRPKGFTGEEPALVFDEPDAARTVVIERLAIAGLRHASPATLVLKSAGPGRYSNTPGCGKLFMEDLGDADFRFDHPQRIWARQWNPERHGEGPCITSHGATIWCLGFKTEYESSKLWADSGAQTEILGAFIYPIGQIPAFRPLFKNTDSKMSLIYGTSVYQSDHQLHILDTAGTNVKEIGKDALMWVGNRARMDLYTSDATGK